MSHEDKARIEAPSSPWPRLITLAILVIALVGALVVGTATSSENRLTPDLALDLEGGTQIILTPVTTDGSEITDEDIQQAIEIIRNRVDATGVSEAEITSQGRSNIVVGLPGHPSEETLNLVRTSAVLRLRPVINLAQAELASRNLTAGVDEATAKKAADLNGDGKISDKPEKTPDGPQSTDWITEQVLYDLQTRNCADPATARVDPADDVADLAIVACDPETGAGYILGPTELTGGDLTQAASGPRTNSQGQTIGGWQVNIEFTSDAGEKFYNITNRLVGNGYGTPQNQFAMVLDGSIISVAGVQQPISGGSASISGSFTAEQANTLANQLSFGSLPLNFQVQSEEQISATLGSEQLVNSLIAGAIGLGLVVLYLLWQYQGLGIIAVLSIFLTTGLSFLIISLLSWTMGYRLSLAGVVGLIISVGIAADSFIVFFERIRDEIREGRSLKKAVDVGWARARQTILVSDAVNFVAAIVLYILAVGGVRGFAFTLGLTTVIDLLIVMMFTYPVMRLLIRTKFFGHGHRLSGMAADQLGAEPAYIGRGQVRTPEKKGSGKKGRKTLSKKEREEIRLEEKMNRGAQARGERTSTLAARRAAERRKKNEGE